jgi:hypothetical protein
MPGDLCRHLAERIRLKSWDASDKNLDFIYSPLPLLAMVEAASLTTPKSEASNSGLPFRDASRDEGE